MSGYFLLPTVLPTKLRRNFPAIAGITFAVAVVLVAMSFSSPAAAQGGSRSATLQERLTFGLQARRPQEIAFVEAVVDTVERGRLPLRLVDRTFFWAREKSAGRDGQLQRRPIIYFQPALQIQAKRLGITIRRNG